MNDPLAPFLESRAYAVEMGATAEFRKMEWMALDEDAGKIYLAMSEINKTMSDGEGDIDLEENNCGIVYEAELDEDNNIDKLEPLIVGGPYDADAENRCALDNIANPDALFVDTVGNLWIGEDSGNHVNNAIWKWDGEELTRFATLPTESEATGVFVTDAGDLFFSVQHPSAMSLYPYNRAVVGVVRGFDAASDDFEAVSVPEGDDMHTLQLPEGLRFQILQRVGEEIPNDIYGQRFGQIDRLNGGLQEMCNQPDGNVFLPVNSKSTEGYLYTNYECRPGNVGKIYLRKLSSGWWHVLEGENVDFACVNGTWNNCGASRSPWNTMLTSEEYEPPALEGVWQRNVANLTDYLGKQANPYDYGWLVEVHPDTDGNSVASRVQKRYAMGRFSHEMGMVMPDGKTSYHGDDGTGVVLFKFVADEAGDLSAGTLYAAKVTQNNDESFDLEWIELGHGEDDLIAEALFDMDLPQ